MRSCRSYKVWIRKSLRIHFLSGILLLINLTGGNAQRIFVIGNTYTLQESSRYFESLEKVRKQSKQDTYLILNGDLIDGHLDKKGLSEFLDALHQTGFTQIIFNTGDSDWGYSSKKGWEIAVSLEEFITSYKDDRFVFSIEDACPGPETIDIGEFTTLVLINTQWWNHPYNKPGLENADCDIATKGDFLEELDDIINESRHKNILIAGHYPVISYGKYGGYFPFSAYITPLPVLGSFITAYHQNVGSAKDITNSNYDELREEMFRVLNENEGIVYVSSHERNIQLISMEHNYLINSGAPVSGGYIQKRSPVISSSREAGMVSLEYNRGTITYQQYKIQKDSFLLSGTHPLFRSPCNYNLSEVSLPAGRSIEGCDSLLLEGSAARPPVKSDSIVKIAGAGYKAGRLEKLMFGKHYRSTWTVPVKVPVLDMDTTFGGLKPYEKGGGRQTTSIKLLGGDDREYTFRSVDKDPVQALDYRLRDSFVADVVRDQTTTQHPYGSLVTDQLMNQLDILHPHPQLYFMPTDSLLGLFLENFTGMLGLLEEKPFDPDEDEYHFAGADDVVKSHELFRELYEDHDHVVDQKSYVLARMFDIFVGDWGRHEGNWKWAGYELEKGERYKPIPRDRDHVFSVWDGLFPWLADREWAKPSGEHFAKKIKDVRSLTWPARHLDRLVANEMTRDDWIEAAETIQTTISDDDIRKAVNSLPAEAYATSGKELEAKLMARKGDLKQYAILQYNLMAKQVNIVGSEKQEFFDINRLKNGSVRVRMMDKDNVTSTDPVFYDRTFYPGETKEIRVFGLEDEDSIRISGEARKSLLIRIIDGPGKDWIIDTSKAHNLFRRTLIYSRDSNYIEGSGETRIVRSADDDAYNYVRTAFAYNRYLPLIFFGSNSNDGFFFSPGIQFTNQKYGKPDFSSKHFIRALFSTRGVVLFRYDAIYRQVLGTMDLAIGGLYAHPDRYSSFFGLGNETTKSEKLFDDYYYNTANYTRQIYSGLTRNFLDASRLYVLFRYENTRPVIRADRILGEDRIIPGKEHSEMIETNVGIDLDFRDNKGLPKRGTRLVLEYTPGWFLNKTGNYSTSLGYLEYFISNRSPKPVTFGLRGGGAGSTGSVPFYKLPSLGQNQFLLGYQANRFRGTSMWFVNGELRWTFINLEKAFLPLKIGVKGFYDIGKVYYSDFVSTTLHAGYGGGLYVVPFKETFTISISAAFSEEESGLIQIGIGTPLQ